MAALCGAIFALAFVPLCSAQAQTSSSDQVAHPQDSPAVVSQIQQLQEEVETLQGEISELKRKTSETPIIKPAVFVEPTASEPLSASDSAAPAAATTAMQTPAQASKEKVTLGSLLGPTTLSGLVDTYYGYDFNHPSNMQTGLRFFDANENQFGLSLVELSVAKTPSLTGGVAARTGYTVSAGFGQTINTVNGTGSSSDGSLAGARYLKEAYFSYMAPIGKGLKIDVGKFVTTAGDEVIETNGNWNYSRSILFYYAIPFYHYGVRATYAPNSKVSLQASISNGWNNIVAFSKSKTYGGSISLTPNAKWAFTETYYAGPINDINYWRQLSDTIITYTPNSKLAFAVNGDYGRDAEYSGGPVAQWWGPAGYVKYSFGSNDNLAVRYEYYGDPEGLTLFGGFGYNSGHAQEVTTTYTHMLANSLMTRLEYRYDFASQPIFQRGAIPNAVKTQNSITIGMVYSFSSQEGQ
jgi:Putative beta-barrel porin-2, OmpL-like. bbp2